ncbi:MAG TPA: hypothetical protein PKA48_01325, partial [Candidatus Obscuribacter sp.]|nr:hypothetical protein [Candidatus Obscuribacter sp.]
MKSEFSSETSQVNMSDWTEANLLNPAANVARDAYNAVIFNTVGKVANSASQAIVDKDIMKRAEHAKVGEVSGFSKEMVSQA